MPHPDAPASNQLFLDSSPDRPNCPYCRSSDVVIPAKRSALSYFRCNKCGELWHPDRVSAVGGRGPWRA